MDKQKVIEIADSDCSEVIYQFTEQDLMKFAAAILLEAAKVCNRYERQDAIVNTRLGWSATTTPPVVIADEFIGIAKELTQ